MKKVLPIKKPVNTTWTWNANLFAVLENYEASWGWLFNRYISIGCYTDFRNENQLIVDFLPNVPGFETCELFHTQLLTREFIDRFHYDDLTDFFIGCIDMDYYIYGVFDEGCFLSKGRYKKFPHELFIYGYDTERRVFETADFFNGFYSFLEVPFHKIEEAYKNINYEEDYLKSERTTIVLSKMKQEIQSDLINLFVLDGLQNYLDDEPLFNQIYGTRVYDHVISYYLENRNKDFNDVKPLHNLYIHKVLMSMRLKYMMENNHIGDIDYLINDYKKLEDNMLMYRNLYLKYRYEKTRPEIIERIASGLEEVKTIERKIFEHILYLYKKYEPTKT